MAPAPDFRIDKVTLRVSDVELSAGFYAGLVGLRIAELSSDRAQLADPADPGSTRLELIRAEQPGRAPHGAAGLFHTAFLYPGRPGLGAALQRIAEGNYQFTGAADHGVSEALYLNDPDGLGLELYRDRPREQWPMDGERVAMFSAPLDLGPIGDEAAEGSGEETAHGVGIGHVHLSVSALEPARAFWIDQVGLRITAEIPSALFMAAGDYHHHIAANTWQSAGAAPAPAEGPGLDTIRLGGGPAGRLLTPEGVAVEKRRLA